MKTPVTRLGAALAGTVLAFALAAPVLAHAELVSSNPDDGAVLDTPPTAVVLRFSEPLDAGRSRFVLKGPGGNVGTGRVAPDAPRVMRLDGLSLAAGDYTVQMTVATPDGHIERPTISFTVEAVAASPSDAPSEAASEGPSEPPASEAPSASAAPTTAPSTAPSASAAPDDQPASSSGSDVLLPIVIGLLLVAGVGAYVLRRSRSA